MSSRLYAVLIGVVSTVAAWPASAAPGDARDLIAKQEDAHRLRDVTATATLTTTTEGGDTKAKTFSYWRKLSPDGQHFRTLARFLAPAEIRNEGILIEERPSGENDVQLYLPRFHKVRRVEAQSQSSSFMGSVFSYSDLAETHVDDFKHETLRTEACPVTPSVQCTVIASTPASDAVRDRTGYARSVRWVRADNFMTEQAECYGVDGALWKRLVAKNLREIDPAAHKWIALSVRLEDVKAKRATELVLDQVKVNTNVPDATFTTQNLAQD